MFCSRCGGRLQPGVPRVSVVQRTEGGDWEAVSRLPGTRHDSLQGRYHPSCGEHMVARRNDRLRRERAAAAAAAETALQEPRCIRCHDRLRYDFGEANGYRLGQRREDRRWDGWSTDATPQAYGYDPDTVLPGRYCLACARTEVQDRNRARDEAEDEQSGRPPRCEECGGDFRRSWDHSRMVLHERDGHWDVRRWRAGDPAAWHSHCAQEQAYIRQRERDIAQWRARRGPDSRAERCLCGQVVRRGGGRYAVEWDIFENNWLMTDARPETGGWHYDCARHEARRRNMAGVTPENPDGRQEEDEEMMTARHCEAIAESLSALRRVNGDYGEPGSPGRRAADGLLSQVTARLAEIMAADNPAFDSASFMLRAGMRDAPRARRS